MDANSNCEAHRAWRRRHQVHLSVVAIASTLLHMLSLLHELARFMNSLHTDCFAGDHAETLCVLSSKSKEAWKSDKDAKREGFIQSLFGSCRCLVRTLMEAQNDSPPRKTQATNCKRSGDIVHTRCPPRGYS